VPRRKKRGERKDGAALKWGRAIKNISTRADGGGEAWVLKTPETWE